MNHWRATTATLVLAVSVLAAPAGAVTLEYYINPPAGLVSKPDASGGTINLTTDRITSWDITVMDGSTPVTFEKGSPETEFYTPHPLAGYWGADFNDGSGDVLDLLFADPGLGAPTVSLLPDSKFNSVAIDNPSVSVVSEPTTFGLMSAAFGLSGYTLRRRAVDLAIAISV